MLAESWVILVICRYELRLVKNKSLQENAHCQEIKIDFSLAFVWLCPQYNGGKNVPTILDMQQPEYTFMVLYPLKYSWGFPYF